MGLLTCFALLHASAEAVRIAKSKDSTSYTWGRVSELYTWGAPRVADEPLENRQEPDGCFKGRRLVNTKGENGVILIDAVTTVPWRWEHPLMETAELNGDDKVYKRYECGDKNTGLFNGRVEAPEGFLHSGATYDNRITSSTDGSIDARTKEITSVGLLTSYMGDDKSIRAQISSTGWTLNGTAVLNATGGSPKETHLFMKGKDCIVTFQGTDDGTDAVDDVSIAKTTYCKLLGNDVNDPKLHYGFVKQIREITKESSYVSQIQEKLPQCTKVTAVGHSLGGALAALWTACVNNDVGASDDQRKVRWQI